MNFVAPDVKLRVRFWADTEVATAAIWVQDSGIGTPKERQQRISELFQQLHHDNEYPGNGMGRAIARKAVQRNGGAMCLDSGRGRGSRFCVEVPTASQP